MIPSEVLLKAIKMITRYLVLTVREELVTEYATLGNSGLSTSENLYLLGELDNGYDTELEALNRAEELLDNSKNATVEIRKVYLK